jgi:flavodoxin
MTHARTDDHAMSVLVVYESMFGNNAALAHAVAEGVGSVVAVQVVEVSEAPTTIPDDVDLLVVGAPNHAAGLPRPSSREDSRKTGGHPADPAIGVREWLAALELPRGTRVAVYETMMAKPGFLRFVDHAARTVTKRLRRKGGLTVGQAMHFRVAAQAGPLVDGELDRARRWGATLAADRVQPG